MSIELPPPPPKKSARASKRDETYEVQKEKRKQDKKDEQAKAKHDAKLLKEAEQIEAAAKALAAVKKKHGIIAQEVLEAAPQIINEEAGKQIAFQPNSANQIAFLSAAEDEVLYGGGRGSGKSLCLIADPLRYIGSKNFRAVIIRRTMPELKELIGRAKNMYFQIVPSVDWKVKDNMFVFPSGATIEFGYLDSENDLEKYRGQEYTWIGIDEISQLPFYEWYYKLKASLRTSDPTLTTYIRATTNPTGVGIEWVKEYWQIGHKPPNTTIRETFDTQIGKIVVTKKWLHSTVYENVDLIKANPQYVAQLMSAPPHLRKAWLDGDWDAIEGAAFQEFNKATHVVPAFTVPSGWVRFRCADYGYRDGAACLWITIDPATKIHYVYREFVCNGRNSEKNYTAVEFARAIKRIEVGAKEVVAKGVLDSSCWAKRGDVGPSLAEQMIKEGLRWSPADKGNGSRVAGKNKIHQMLIVDEITGKPELMFFDNCLQTIKMMSGIPIDKTNAEDVDTDSPLDHQYDALRYGIMSRPTSAYNNWGHQAPPPPISPTFGY